MNVKDKFKQAILLGYTLSQLGCATAGKSLISTPVENLKVMNKVQDYNYSDPNKDKYGVGKVDGVNSIQYNFTPRNGTSESIPVTSSINVIKQERPGVKVLDARNYNNGVTADNAVILLSPAGGGATSERYIAIVEEGNAALTKISDPSKEVKIGNFTIKDGIIIGEEKKSGFSLEDIVSLQDPLYRGLETLSISGNNLNDKLEPLKADKQFKERSFARTFGEFFEDTLKIVDDKKIDQYLEIEAETAGDYLIQQVGKDAPKNLIDLRKEKEIVESAKGKINEKVDEWKNRDEKIKNVCENEDGRKKVEEDAYHNLLFNLLLEKYPNGGWAINYTDIRGIKKIDNPMLISREFKGNTNYYTTKSKDKDIFFVGSTIGSGRLGEIVFQPNTIRKIDGKKLLSVINQGELAKILGKEFEEEKENTFNVGIGYNHLFDNKLPNGETGIYSINLGGDYGKWNVRVDLGYGKDSSEEDFLKEKKANPKDPRALSAKDTENRRNSVDIYSLGGNAGYRIFGNLGAYAGANISLQENEIYRNIHENLYDRKGVKAKSNDNIILKRDNKLYGGVNAGINYDIQDFRLSLEGGVRGDSLNKKTRWNPSAGGRVTYRIRGQK